MARLYQDARLKGIHHEAMFHPVFRFDGASRLLNLPLE
jgi:hypothetical protein